MNVSLNATLMADVSHVSFQYTAPYTDEQDEVSWSGRVRPAMKLDRAITSPNSASVTLQKDRRPNSPVSQVYGLKF